MPALQVRDFPEELYSELKQVAAAENRSLAQQTVVAVREYVAHSGDAQALRRQLVGERRVGGDPDVLPLYAQRRRAVLEGIRSLPQVDLPTDVDIAGLVREGREERTDRVLASLAGLTADAHVVVTDTREVSR